MQFRRHLLLPVAMLLAIAVTGSGNAHAGIWPAAAMENPPWASPTVVATTGILLCLLGFTIVLRWRVRKVMQEMRHAHAQLELVLEVSPVALFLAHEEDGELQLDWASPNIERLYGFTDAQVFHPGWWWEQVHPDDLPTLEPSVALMHQHPSTSREYRFLDAQGKIHHLHETLRRLPDERGKPLRMLITWVDTSEAKAHTDALTHVAHHDGLTQLPNRQLLQLFLGDALQAPRRLAIAVIDLDRLRGINDTLGHAVGDQILRAASQRLSARLPENGFLARVGGDEFAVVLPAATDATTVEMFTREVLDAFGQPLLGHTAHPVVVTASIGIAHFPDDGEQADTLLQHAELALYEAKHQGPGRCRHFEPAMSAGAAQRHALENGLRKALAEQQLLLYYQPQINLQDGSVAGVEALLRWQHPEWGMVPPSQFIPVAEESGLIEEIGRWALHQACLQLREWDAGGLHVASMAVNCSVQQLDAEQLPAAVARSLRVSGIAPNRLELEITESMLMKDPEHAVVALNALKVQGLRLAIDDFGTGYSSLAYLRRLPVDRLKIDRAFVSGIGNDPGDEQICRTVIALAQNLGLDTLAEGVEHADQARFLRDGGCALAQGFHFAHPLPADALADWLRQYQPPATS